MVVLRIKLKELLRERGLTQGQLHEMSGVRAAYISEISNDNRTTINRANLAKIMEVLNLTDMNQMFELVNIEETPRI